MIIYCTKRKDTEHVATLLNHRLPTIKRTFIVASSHGDTDSSSKEHIPAKRSKSASGPQKRLIVELTTAAFYHAGVEGKRRGEVQTQFMKGTLRIVVATVAFGMGLNEPDIRAVIHYDMPKSFESFVQEIGRAGRDREQANCHVLIDKMVRALNCTSIYNYM